MTTAVPEELAALIERAACPYISKRGLADALQLPVKTIENWRDQHWTRGYHYIVKGRTTLIVKERAYEWIGQQESDHEAPASKSASGKGSAGSTARRSTVTRMRKLT